MPENIATSVKEFITYLEELAAAHPDLKFIFRGQTNYKWELVPAIQRQLFSRAQEIRKDKKLSEPEKEREIQRARRSLQNNERMMLDEFKKEAIPYLGGFSRDSDDLEWLALAQHHYLPTRLLDWTYHAATALYFAVEGVLRNTPSNKKTDAKSDDYCAVWVAHYDDEYSVEIVQNSKAEKWKQVTPVARPFAMDPVGKDGEKQGVVLFYDPPHITPRLAAQRGCFTLHSSRYPVEKVAWPTAFEPFQILIPYSDVLSIKRTLRQLGNRGASLFPGLDGIAFDIVSVHNLEKRHSEFPL